MEHSTDDPHLWVAAPRHLRRRRFGDDISDLLLVPGAENYPDLTVPVDPVLAAKSAAEPAPPAAQATYQRKRLVALLLVITVAVSLPGLITALLLSV